MRAFARLLDSLVYTQSRNRKVALLGHYFRTAPDPDRGWALAALTDGVPIRLPLRRMLSDLVSRFIDPVLYRLSRDYVGDTAETVSLLWPDDRVVVATPDVSEPPRPRENDEREKPKQLVLEFTPTPPRQGEGILWPSPSPMRGGGQFGHNSGEPPELALGAVIEAMAEG
ncbi:MAG TPA: ATP-dependent DNA ligase, partial [Hyphomicrobium sp.]|nr:ATP-dependent DNA ligase [Hyphomicrobium sp.]